MDKHQRHYKWLATAYLILSCLTAHGQGVAARATNSILYPKGDGSNKTNQTWIPFTSSSPGNLSLEQPGNDWLLGPSTWGAGGFIDWHFDGEFSFAASNGVPKMDMNPLSQVTTLTGTGGFQTVGPIVTGSGGTPGTVSTPGGTNIAGNMIAVSNLQAEYLIGYGPSPTITTNGVISGFNATLTDDPNPSGIALYVKITTGGAFSGTQPDTNLFHVAFPNTVLFAPKVIIVNGDKFSSVDNFANSLYPTNATTSGFDVRSIINLSSSASVEHIAIYIIQ